MTHPQEPHPPTEKRRSLEHSSEEGGGGGDGGSTCSEEYDDARETLSEEEGEGDGEAITDDMFLSDDVTLDKDPLSKLSTCTCMHV